MAGGKNQNATTTLWLVLSRCLIHDFEPNFKNWAFAQLALNMYAATHLLDNLFTNT